MKAFHWLLLGLLTLPCTAANRALLIGIGRYPVQTDRLNGPALDIQNIQRAVLKLGYKKEEVKTLLDEQATLSAITRSIQEWLIDGTRPGDYALLYYTGHGAQIPDQAPLDERDGKDEVLVPYDFQRLPQARPGDRNLSNVLVDDDLDKLLRRIPSKHLTVLLDSCFSGGGLKGVAGDEPLLPKFLPGGTPLPPGATRGSVDEPTGTMVFSRAVGFGAMLASREDERALDTPKGGTLTLAITKVIEGAPDTVTLSMLQDAASDEIGRRTQYQHPLLGGSREAWGRVLHIPTYPGASQTAGTPAAGGSAHAEARVSRLFREAQEFVRGAPRYADIRVAKPNLVEGERLIISFTAPSDGYVNILNIPEDAEEVDVLYPNRYHPGNQVRAGELVKVPAGGFSLNAKIHGNASVQRNLVIAFFSAEPVALVDGSWNQIFQQLKSPVTREYEVREERGEIVGAGYVLTKITRRRP